MSFIFVLTDTRFLESTIAGVIDTQGVFSDYKMTLLATTCWNYGRPVVHVFVEVKTLWVDALGGVACKPKVD